MTVLIGNMSHPLGMILPMTLTEADISAEEALDRAFGAAAHSLAARGKKDIGALLSKCNFDLRGMDIDGGTTAVINAPPEFVNNFHPEVINEIAVDLSPALAGVGVALGSLLVYTQTANANWRQSFDNFDPEVGF